MRTLIVLSVILCAYGDGDDYSNSEVYLECYHCEMPCDNTSGYISPATPVIETEFQN